MRGFVSVTAVVLIVIGIGASLVTGLSLPGPTAPGLSESLIQAVNGEGSSWHITAAQPESHTSTTQAQEIKEATTDGSRVVAAGLVRWTNDYPRHSKWTWAVFIDPPGPHLAPPGMGPFNYDVVLVDAETGVVLASGTGEDNALPPLRVWRQN